MNTKTPLTLLGAATLLFATAVSLPASADVREVDCVELSTGETACGYATASVCAGAGEGEATGLVDWKLTVRTTNWYSTKDYTLDDSAAFAGGGPAAVCTTSTCTWATLYANDEVVATSMGVCW